MNNSAIRIFIVEDDLDFCYLIKKTLKTHTDFAVLGDSQDAASALTSVKELQPDIVLMDLNLSSTDLDGIEAGREIRLATDAKIIILTAFEDPEIVISACVKSFASAYIFKSQFECLADSIRAAAKGSTPQQYLICASILSCLSPAEKSVFDLMLGKPMDLQSSSKTIANQKTSILKKLGLKSQKELIHIFSDRY
ncbi:response regulator transcription factor [Anaerostipes sp.]|uniref:response regulator transcription factor n=1 Tax=Anaerostipes sp. TaxID=1872530 RepID=UPI0025BCB47F|nr:response regulator transcription factor [Anaerostipes sp.]MBS7008428.1 response regulator transcription factor [Anaerostipes sp.]